MIGAGIEKALELVGIDERLVGEFLGRPCNCEERRRKLDALEAFARRVLKGKIEGASRYLANILSAP